MNDEASRKREHEPESSLSDEGGACAEPGSLAGLPVLPLPDYALFPNTLVPFHVYEPRFRRMLADCLAERRLLVVVGLAPGWESAPEGDHPPTHAIGGLGRVLSERRYQDGRVDLFVHAIARVRVTGPLGGDDWPIADVEPLEDAPRLTREGATQRLVAVATQLVVGLGDLGEPVRQLLASSGDVAVLSNRLAAALVERAADRQALLEERCPTARAERLVELLAARLITVERGPADAWLM